MARVADQEPIARPGMFAAHDATSMTYEHPAYGCVVVHRVSGGGGGRTLFDSDFRHQRFVSLSIYTADLHRDLAQDRHHARREIVEVHLSEAQWATLVSSFGMGDGVPCTINREQGNYVPGIPFRHTRAVARDEVREKSRELAAQVDATRQAVQAEMSGLSAKKRDAILDHLHTLERGLSSSMPWILQQFEEHMETTTERAKAEVEAYIAHRVQTAGLQALTADTAPVVVPAQIAAGNDAAVPE